VPRKPKHETQVRFKKFLSAKPLLSKFDNSTSDSQIARSLGVHPSAVSAWQRGGRIHWVLADSIAVKLGTHPAELWGDDWSTLQLPELTDTLNETA